MYRDKIKIIVTIADIHIGVQSISADEFKYQLYERFIKPLEGMVFIDIITINGDISDSALLFNSKYAEVYLWLADKIISIAKSKGAAVIIVKGTLSHDFEQINNLKIYENSDIYLIDEPKVIKIKELKIYCLPDIYIKPNTEKELYDYKNGEFDLILGHGSVTETQFITQEGEHSISKNIIYNSKQLLRMCKGPIIFGHIHIYTNIKNRIFYTGSFTRFIHGEEISKGFLVTAYIPETAQFIVERVINDLAFNFDTYVIKHQTFETREVEDIVKRVEDFIKEFNVDRLCLDITYLNTDVNVAKIDILRNYFNRNKIVNKMKFKAISKKESELIEEAEVLVDESKKYLMDKSLRFEEKLQRFIREEYGMDLALEKIETVLYSDNLLLRGG